jgi:hypothetical protein
MVIMIDITVESTGLYKSFNIYSLYAIIAFDYYFAGWQLRLLCVLTCYCLRDDFTSSLSLKLLNNNYFIAAKTICNNEVQPEVPLVSIILDFTLFPFPTT